MTRLSFPRARTVTSPLKSRRRVERHAYARTQHHHQHHHHIHPRYGIGGAAVATSASFILSSCLLVRAVHKSGQLPPTSTWLFKVPSRARLAPLLAYAAPLFVIILTRVAGFVQMSITASSLGMTTLGAHQVALAVFTFCAYFGADLPSTSSPQKSVQRHVHTHTQIQTAYSRAHSRMCARAQVNH